VHIAGTTRSTNPQQSLTHLPTCMKKVLALFAPILLLLGPVYAAGTPSAAAAVPFDQTRDVSGFSGVARRAHLTCTSHGRPGRRAPRRRQRPARQDRNRGGRQNAAHSAPKREYQGTTAQFFGREGSRDGPGAGRPDAERLGQDARQQPAEGRFVSRHRQRFGPHRSRPHHQQPVAATRERLGGSTPAAVPRKPKSRSAGRAASTGKTSPPATPTCG
jgi:hypothetical protein